MEKRSSNDREIIIKQIEELQKQKETLVAERNKLDQIGIDIKDLKDQIIIDKEREKIKDEDNGIIEKIDDQDILNEDIHKKIAKLKKERGELEGVLKTSDLEDKINLTIKEMDSEDEINELQNKKELEYFKEFGSDVNSSVDKKATDIDLEINKKSKKYNQKWVSGEYKTKREWKQVQKKHDEMIADKLLNGILDYERKKSEINSAGGIVDITNEGSVDLSSDANKEKDSNKIYQNKLNEDNEAGKKGDKEYYSAGDVVDITGEKFVKLNPEEIIKKEKNEENIEKKL